MRHKIEGILLFIGSMLFAIPLLIAFYKCDVLLGLSMSGIAIIVAYIILKIK